MCPLVIFSGCMKLGADYHRPDIGVRIPERYQHDLSVKALSQPEDRWWRAFGDAELNQLINEALLNNLDIKKAAARILEVRSNLVQSRADRFPVLNLQGQVQRQRQTVNVPVGLTLQSQRQTSDIHNLSFPASFELDLWGRLARAEEGARADLLEAEENRSTIAQTVVAELISLYFQTESLERRIQVAHSSIRNYRRSLDLVEKRYGRGLTSALDVRAARTFLAQAEASLPSLRQELGIAQQKLGVLIGRYPETSAPRTHAKDYYKSLSPVPPGLPSELLLRRPDIRAAEARLKALNARVGVAKASRFPRITLTGTFGYTSEELGRLFRHQSELWNLALGVAQPLFDAGKLESGQRASEARYKQGLAEYAKTVLNAFSEAEKALLTRREQLERRDRVLNFLAQARATQKIAELRYERGLVGYLNVLEAQQTRFRAEESLIMVNLAILSNRVSLHRALGGGWAELLPGH